MQPHLTTRDGNIIPLTDEIYESILQLVEGRTNSVEYVNSIEELEDEFAELFTDSASTNDLLAEHKFELAREKKKLERFD